MSKGFIPYGRQTIDEDDLAAVAAVLRSDWLTTGPAVTEFEVALSAVTGAPTLAVNSGTAALHCAYAAAGLGPGNRLLTTPLTFVATASTAVHLGAEVSFADVTHDTLTLDPDAAAAAMTADTRVVAPVDYAGHPSDFDSLRKVADDHEALLVVDASHSLGATYRGQPVGELADLATFSFHPVKTIATGEGGAVAGRDATLLERVARFRNHGLVTEPAELRNPDEGPWHREVHEFGLNYRMPDVLAALGTSQLRKIDAFLGRRRSLVERYRELLAGVEGVTLPEQRPGAEPAWHLFAVRVLDGRRRQVFEAMRAADIGVQVHYLPVHLHPALAAAGFRRGMFPVAEAAYDELISLPLYPGLTDQQQERVVDELRSALRG